MGTTRRPETGAAVALPVRERRFYLQQFTGRTLVVAAPDDTDDAAVGSCIADLVAEGVRVVHVGPGGRVAHWQPDDAGVVAVWRQLRRHGRMRISLPADSDLLGTAVALAIRLRAFKLVLLDPDHPRPAAGARPESFVTLGADEAAGGGLQALAARALSDGVDTVNLCHPADLGEELLTYAGAGTCLTLQDYCRVGRLGIDDFPQVVELIRHGVEEGYLKDRDADAVARLVVNGYGARVGGHHLAGFAALLTEPYADQRMGEVCALTTISRFSGGGVGGQVVDRMLADAVANGLHGVFACTTAEPAARFFRHLGFVEVPQGEVPAVKWEGYDPARRPAVRAFVHHLAMIGPG
jgi:amino-acid N-acetyltransferase